MFRFNLILIVAKYIHNNIILWLLYCNVRVFNSYLSTPNYGRLAVVTSLMNREADESYCELKCSECISFKHKQITIPKWPSFTHGMYVFE